MAKIHRRTIQKDLHDPDNQDGVITHLEPDILECEVKWALGSITTNKASGYDGIPVELFQILKDDAVKVLHSMSANLENSAVATELEKVSFHSNPEKGNAKECSKDHTIVLISHTSKLMLKILQTRLQQYMNHEIPDIQVGARDQIVNTHWIIEKAREFQKKIYFSFIDYSKAFDYVDHNTLWKILKEMGKPDHLTCLQRNLYAVQEATVRTRNGKTDWFQKSEKKYIKAV